MKAAIYARVSTEEQAVENQIPVLENWAKQRGWVIAEVYREDASAWKAGRQKELARLRRDARQGKFNIVLVWALDRITRSGPAAAFEILKSFSDYNVKVYSYQESWTEAPNDAMYEMLVAVFTTIAKWESDRRSERTRAGMDRARQEGTKSGKPIGRPRKSQISDIENPRAMEQVRDLQKKLKMLEKQISGMVVEKGSPIIIRKN
jgi:putative DNA-invertase from lambdoid prophage Rac